MARLFKMALLEDVQRYIEEGWTVSTGKNINLGGWPSVWMEKEE